MIRRFLLSLVFAVLSCAPTFAAVALDACGTQTFVSGSGTTANYTGLTVGAGTNRGLVGLIVFGNAGGSVSGLSATWNGTAMTVLKLQTGSGGAVGIVGLANPASGNNTLALSWTTGAEAHVVACAWTGVDQTGGVISFPNATSTTGNSAGPNITVTTATNNAAMAQFATSSSFTGGTASNTEIYLDNSGAFSAGEAQRTNPTSGGASVAFSVTSVSNPWTAAGVDILAAGSGGTVLCTRMLMGVGC